MKIKYRLLIVVTFLLACGIISYVVMRLMRIPDHDVGGRRIVFMCVILILWLVYTISIYVWKRNVRLKAGYTDVERKNNGDMHMKRWKQIILLFLFILDIACLWLPLLTINAIRTSNDIYKYWWAFFVFLPIPILSIVLGRSRDDAKSRKNIVAGKLAATYLIFFGTVVFIIHLHVLFSG